MDECYRINNLFPSVTEIRIHYKEEYRSCFGIYNKEQTLFRHPEDLAEFKIRCANNDCTRKFFDLYSEVSNAIHHRECEANGVLECEGQEAKDHQYNCPTTLEYTIQIKYNSQI